MTTNRNLHQRFTFLLLAIALVSYWQPGPAQAQDSRWHLRLRGVLVNGDQAFSVDDPSGDRVLAGGNAAPGAGIAVEYRLSERLGVEVGSVFAKVPDFDWEASGSSSRTEIGEGPSIRAATASLNLHLTPESRFDLYVAPTVASVDYGDFELDLADGTVHFEADGGVAWGGTIGFDVGLGVGSWSFNAAATYLSSDMEVTERGSSDTVVVPYDPLMVQLGATFAF